MICLVYLCKTLCLFACFHGSHIDLVPPDLGALGLVISASCGVFHLQGPPLWSVGPCFAFHVSPSPYGPPTGVGPMVMSFRIYYFHFVYLLSRGHSLEFDFVLGSFVVSGRCIRCIVDLFFMSSLMLTVWRLLAIIWA
jgi:hypothetical protein